MDDPMELDPNDMEYPDPEDANAFGGWLHNEVSPAPDRFPLRGPIIHEGYIPEYGYAEDDQGSYGNATGADEESDGSARTPHRGRLLRDFADPLEDDSDMDPDYDDIADSDL